jgi:hypothetical protein
LRGLKQRAMPGSWPPQDHPYLTAETCAITSPRSYRYNCIAWAAGVDTDYWWPDPMGIGRWPADAPRVVTMEAFVRAFETRGYKLCYDSSLEAGVEKVAIYGKTNPSDGLTIPTHAARQLESGEWTSKMGSLEDVQHKTADDVNGRVYGKPVYYMSRPRPSTPKST